MIGTIIGNYYAIIYYKLTLQINRVEFGLADNTVGHSSLASGRKSRSGYIKRVFHLSIRPVTIGLPCVQKWP